MRLPASARAIAAATTDAVAAATARDLTAFEEATDRLAGADPERVRIVLGVVVRSLLEDLHPDGMSSDDLLELIKSCARTSFGWYPQIDVQALVIVVTGALGVQDPDLEPRTFTPLEVAKHAPLYLTELLQSPKPHQTLPEALTTAFERIAEEQLNELP